MDFLKTAKAICVAVFGLLSSWLGVLAIPVYVLVGCNVMDYATGLAAAHRRGQKVSSYIGVLGIAKKVCMWLLIAVGAVVDWLLLYAGDQLGGRHPPAHAGGVPHGCVADYERSHLDSREYRGHRHTPARVPDKNRRGPQEQD